MHQSEYRSMLEGLEQRRLLSADLQGALTVSVGAFLPGSNASGAFKILNNGTSTVTTNFDVNFRLSKNTVYGDSDDLGSVTVPVTTDIPPGGISVQVAAVFPIPNVPAGAYVVVGKVDSGNTVAETNENNNTFASTGAGTIDILDSAGRLLVNGTDAGETIIIGRNTIYSTGYYTAQVGSAAARSYGANVTGVLCDAKGGDDVVVINNNAPNVSVFGGDGNDRVVDTGGANTLSGGAGKDTLYGGDGNDRLNGNGGNDRCFGEGGLDRLYGYDGNDILFGGSSRDRIYGGAGADSCYGDSGDDLIYVKNDGSIDSVFGGSGTDGAQSDASDVLTSIEVTL